MNVYDELFAKAQTSAPITWYDMRRLAEVDAVVSAYLPKHRAEVWSEQNAFRAMVCVLAAELNATRAMLAACYERNGITPTVTVVDNEGKIEARLKQGDPDANP